MKYLREGDPTVDVGRRGANSGIRGEVDTSTGNLRSLSVIVAADRMCTNGNPASQDGCAARG